MQQPKEESGDDSSYTTREVVLTVSMRRSRSFSIRWLLILLLVSYSAFARANQTVFQNGPDGYTNVQDATLRGDFPELKAANLWGEPILYVAGVPWGGFQMSALVRFDNMTGTGKNQIPLGATIIGAKLELFKLKDFPKDEGQYAKSAPADTISVYRMKTHFLAGAINDPKNLKAASFSYRANDLDLPQFWGEKNQLENGPVADVDFVKQPVAEVKLQPGMENQWTSWDIKATVAGWVGGQSPNEGLYLMAHAFYTGASFASSEDKEVEHRPRLIVEWTPAAK